MHPIGIRFQGIIVKPMSWAYVQRVILVDTTNTEMHVGKIYDRKNGHWKLKGVAFGKINDQALL